MLGKTPSENGQKQDFIDFTQSLNDGWAAGGVFVHHILKEHLSQVFVVPFACKKLEW